MLWPYLLFLIVSWVGTGYELYLQVKFLLGIAGDFRKAWSAPVDQWSRAACSSLKSSNFGEKLNFVADGKCGQVFDKLEQSVSRALKAVDERLSNVYRYLWGGAAILLTLHGLTWICVAILIHRIRADNERGSDEESKLRSLAHFEKRTLAASQRQGLLSASQSARARRLLSEPEKAFALPRAEERWASLDKTATRHARSNRRRRPKRRLEQSFQT